MDNWGGIVETIIEPVFYLLFAVVAFFGVIKPLFRYLSIWKQVTIETTIKKEFLEKRALAKQNSSVNLQQVEQQGNSSGAENDVKGAKAAVPAEQAKSSGKQSGLDAVEQQVKKWVRED